MRTSVPSPAARPLAGLLAAGAIAAGAAGVADAATKDVSYTGSRNTSVYASFVVHGTSKVTGLYVGGVCLPNVSVVEPGETTPLRIRSGRFSVTRKTSTFRVTLTARKRSATAYRVDYRIDNLRAKRSCTYSVLARRQQTPS